jgi:hypothetical protein
MPVKASRILDGCSIRARDNNRPIARQAMRSVGQSFPRVPILELCSGSPWAHGSHLSWECGVACGPSHASWLSSSILRPPVSFITPAECVSMLAGQCVTPDDAPYPRSRSAQTCEQSLYGGDVPSAAASCRYAAFRQLVPNCPSAEARR